nr:PREDICTED: reversion-inducing cysteine-rich protein with Kazal motifs [Bemisia tabaci]
MFTRRAYFAHVLVLFLNSPLIFASLEGNCCSRAEGACRSACEQLSPSNFAADTQARLQRVADLENVCNPQLFHFWRCINGTLEEINKSPHWHGRPCCTFAQSERCKEACLSANSRSDLVSNCRYSDELALFTCVDRQKLGAECCSNARSLECEGACRAVFRSQLTPSHQVRMAVTEACSQNSPKVTHCLKNIIRVAPVANPHKYLHCCEKSTDSQCRESCRKSLRIKSTDHEIIDSLQEGGCGPPLLHLSSLPLWQCFMQKTEDKESNVDRTGLDAAKLHCCYRAVSPQCRRLCLETFSTEWTKSWENFDKECLSHTSEESLFYCLEEVEEPCELGCDGLSYCTNFNNRPTQLFRSCSNVADEAARYDVALWQQQGTLVLPGLQLPVKNISSCSPQAWKAVACTIQIKPCQRHSHINTICREDCFELLNRCLDWDRMPKGHSAAAVCNKLSSNSAGPCVSLQPFLEPSNALYPYRLDQLTTPCRGDPCPFGQVCSVNRNCRLGLHCPAYTCTPGCKLGEVSQYIVPEGSYVRIPAPSGQKGYLKICRCMSDGSIGKCQPMPYFPLEACWLGVKQIDHGAWFYMECNVCSCYAGEITCTKKQCDIPALGGHDFTYTSLPCNCARHYVPVCGRNGNTYPNSCLAKCAGLTDADFEFGQCESLNACDSKTCPEGETCVRARQVCLSLLHKPCKQYQCVNKREACSSLPKEHVCDTDGQEHHNICFLARYGKTLAYHGPCLHGCSNSGPVCGVDANTYVTECAAQAQYVAIDYRGPCTSVGLATTHRCARVVCPPLPIPDCVGITPPGACCPVCAGALRILYSQKQVDRALYALKEGAAMGSLTVSAVIRALDRLIQVAECSARGHLTIELDLMVLVIPVTPRPSALQLEACVREAEKLASLIHRGSPRILSELSLSALTEATVVHSEVTSAASLLVFPSCAAMLVAVLCAGKFLT